MDSGTEIGGWRAAAAISVSKEVRASGCVRQDAFARTSRSAIFAMTEHAPVNARNASTLWVLLAAVQQAADRRAEELGNDHTGELRELRVFRGVNRELPEARDEND